MAASQFYLQSVKQREVGWVVDDIRVVFAQKLSGEKEVHCHDATVVLLSPKFGVKSSHICTPSPEHITKYAELTVRPAGMNSL
jgi:hypothetical protein